MKCAKLLQSYYSRAFSIGFGCLATLRSIVVFAHRNIQVYSFYFEYMAMCYGLCDVYCRFPMLNARKILTAFSENCRLSEIGVFRRNVGIELQCGRKK